MLRVLAREDVNRDLFADPQQSYAEAVQFYRHDVDWANRMLPGVCEISSVQPPALTLNRHACSNGSV